MHNFKCFHPNEFDFKTKKMSALSKKTKNLTFSIQLPILQANSTKKKKKKKKKTYTNVGKHDFFFFFFFYTDDLMEID